MTTYTLLHSELSEVETYFRDLDAGEAIEQPEQLKQFPLEHLPLAKMAATFRASHEPEQGNEFNGGYVLSWARQQFPEMSVHSRTLDGDQVNAPAVARGELADGCWCIDGYCVFVVTAKGFPNARLLVGIDDDWGPRHEHCMTLEPEQIENILRAVPEAYRRHRRHTLEPYSQSPVPVAHQRSAIMNLPSDLRRLQGLLMVGPAGTCKTTYAAVSILDTLTLRASRMLTVGGIFKTGQWGWSCEPKDLGFFRVKVPDWLDELHAYDTRDFEAWPPINPPSVTTKLIQQTHERFPPILWIEEIDKYAHTTTRRNSLYRLVDAVYERGGTLIVTSNMNLEELREHLGDAIYRRITGCNDDPEKYMIFDLFQAVAANTSKKKRAG